MFSVTAFNKAVKAAGIMTLAEELKQERHAEKHYFDGKPCKVCGETTRFKSNKRCVACKHEMDAWNYQQRKLRQSVGHRHDTEVI